MITILLVTQNIFFSGLYISKGIKCKNMRSRNRVQYVHTNVLERGKLYSFLQNKVLRWWIVCQNGSEKCSAAVWTCWTHCCAPRKCKILKNEIVCLMLKLVVSSKLKSHILFKKTRWKVLKFKCGICKWRFQWLPLALECVMQNSKVS